MTVSLSTTTATTPSKPMKLDSLNGVNEDVFSFPGPLHTQSMFHVLERKRRGRGEGGRERQHGGRQRGFLSSGTKGF